MANLPPAIPPSHAPSILMGRMEAGGAVAPGGSSNLVEVSAVAVPQDEVNAAQALMHAPNVPMPTKIDPLHKGPKEPKTPYNFYCEVRRPHIVAAHPEAGAPSAALASAAAGSMPSAACHQLPAAVAWQHVFNWIQ